MKEIINFEFNEHIKVAKSLKNLNDKVASSAEICINSLKHDGKIILFGNGGSAADSQHIAAELVGRYKEDRKSLPAIALTTDTSAITAIGNDFGFNNIFNKQVESIANKGDVVIGISTSGNSRNVFNGLEVASSLGCKTIGLSGRGGGVFNECCDINIIIASDDTPRIQEMHILIGHVICHLIDQAFKN